MCRIRHCLLDLVIMGLQPGYISRIGQDEPFYHVEQYSGIPALRIQWVEKGASQLLITIKAKADRGQVSVALLPAEHVKHDSPAVALGIYTVGFYQGVFIIR